LSRSNPPIQSWSLRSLPPLTWAMVLLGLIFVTTTINSGNRSLLGMLAGLAPFLFAATVTYMKPSDARFLYGAVLIGVGRGLTVLATLIANQQVLRGELAQMTFDTVALVHAPEQAVRTLLLGLAAGGVPTRIGLGMLGFGVLLAAAALVWQVVNDDVGLSVVRATIFPIAWAYLAGAAFESRRRLLLLGSLVLLALEVTILVIAAMNLGPQTDFGPINLAIDIIQLAGWLLLIMSPLRLEMGTQRPLREPISTLR